MSGLFLFERFGRTRQVTLINISFGLLGEFKGGILIVAFVLVTDSCRLDYFLKQMPSLSPELVHSNEMSNQVAPPPRVALATITATCCVQLRRRPAPPFDPRVHARLRLLFCRPPALYLGISCRALVYQNKMDRNKLTNYL